MSPSFPGGFTRTLGWIRGGELEPRKEQQSLSGHSIHGDRDRLGSFRAERLDRVDRHHVQRRVREGLDDDPALDERRRLGTGLTGYDFQEELADIPTVDLQPPVGTELLHDGSLPVHGWNRALDRLCGMGAIEEEDGLLADDHGVPVRVVDVDRRGVAARLDRTLDGHPLELAAEKLGGVDMPKIMGPRKCGRGLRLGQTHIKQA